jgi:hypothetical protein
MSSILLASPQVHASPDMPRTIWPASHPAIRPTNNMIRRARPESAAANQLRRSWLKQPGVASGWSARNRTDWIVTCGCRSGQTHDSYRKTDRRWQSSGPHPANARGGHYNEKGQKFPTRGEARKGGVISRFLSNILLSRKTSNKWSYQAPDHANFAAPARALRCRMSIPIVERFARD